MKNINGQQIDCPHNPLNFGINVKFSLENTGTHPLQQIQFDMCPTCSSFFFFFLNELQVNELFSF